jgi:voltage-gated sodium channel
MLSKMRNYAHRLTKSHAFEYFIIGLILFNAVVLGLETLPSVMNGYSYWIGLSQQAILGVFIVEAALKIFALTPRADRYFRDGWNVFDFSIIVLSLVPATGGFAVIARLARLMRLLRLVSAVPELRLIVATLVRSIPGMLHIVALMSLMVYIYAIIGYQLFHEHDPTNWGNLGICVLTLFNIITLEGWTEIMATAMELHDWAWVYFVTYVVVATFVVINLFIAIIINNLDEAKLERLQELQEPASQEEILRELRLTQEALQRLEARLDVREEDISEERDRQQ